MEYGLAVKREENFSIFSFLDDAFILVVARQQIMFSLYSYTPPGRSARSLLSIPSFFSISDTFRGVSFFLFVYQVNIHRMKVP